MATMGAGKKGSGLLRGAAAALVGIVSVCGAMAQTPVTSGSPIPTTHATWGQIIKAQMAKNGSVVFLDWANSGLYQLSPGTGNFTNIAAGPPLEAVGTFWNSGMTMDAKDTIYITDRYGSAHFFRIPYNPADGTWDFTSANAWGATIGNGSVSLNTFDVSFINSAAKDGSGTLVVSTETSPSIYTVPVDNQGNWGNVTIIVSGLKQKATRITTDVNGNIYFLEDDENGTTSYVHGIFFIPAGTSGITGAGDGSAEAKLIRLDPTTNTAQFDGIALDAAGNIYLDSQSDSNGGAFNGVLMIPNSSGSPVGVSATSFNYSNATYLAPVPSSATLGIDQRGYLWIPTYGGGWNPPGSTVYPGTKNVVLWQLGAASAGTSPVGTAGTPGTVFFNFSSPVTPGSFALAQPGGGTDFVVSSTNPIADPTATTPQLPCTPGTQYVALASCPLWVALNAHLPGATSAKLQMLDASNKVISQSTTYMSGIGLGADISLLVPTTEVQVGPKLSSPQQTATDSLGDVYVADSGLGQVIEYGPNSTSTSTGTTIGNGLHAPTGVAVDGAGDVFIGDAGKVIEIPYLNGSLNLAGQVTIGSGLGTNLKLATDGNGNVFVSDPDNARIVKLSNPLTTTLLTGLVTVGSGFSKPSAITTDNAGDIFVADGNTLDEIAATFDGPPNAITSSLKAPVTGLAVDPSGSVVVAQTGGIERIPISNGALSANSAVAIDAGAITAPNGLSIDPSGNLYVSDLTGGNPTLELLNLSATANLGQVSPFVPSNPVDVDTFNIGNAPLTIKPDPTFSGPQGSDFSTTAATQNACDTTGATPVAPGQFCIIDVQLTASSTAPAVRTGTMSVTSNAINAPIATGYFSGTAVNNLEASKVTLVVNPTATPYPGSTTATVTVAPTVSAATPTGQVVLTLINQNAALHQTTVLPTGNLINGKAIFTLSNILGGTYTVQAVYHGDSQFSGGRVTQTLTVTTAAPKVTITNPSNISPILGTYYVKAGTSTTLTASVTSSLGTPTGNVSFLNGSNVADATQNPVTLTASGSATFNTLNLAAGSYSLTAQYNGDQNFSKVSSAAATFQVIPPSLLFTASLGAVTTVAGTPVMSKLTLQSLVGYEATNAQNGGVLLACDNTTVPQYSECTFDVPQVQVSVQTPGTTTVTLSTNIPVNVASIHSLGSPIAFAAVFGLGLLGFGFSRRRAGSRLIGSLCLAVMLGAASLGAVGCTNSGFSKTPPAPQVTTPAGTYNVRIYAKDPKTLAVVTLPFTLTVTVTAK